MTLLTDHSSEQRPEEPREHLPCAASSRASAAQRRRFRHSVFLEQVAEAAYRADADARRLELLAQAVHVDFDRVRADFLVPAVELLGELLLVHHAAAAHHQHFEHAELARREVERLAVERRAPARGIEHERAVGRAPMRRRIVRAG